MEERALRMCKNRVSRKTFWPKSEEIHEEWKRLDNEELHDMYSSPYVIPVIKTRMG